MNGRSLSLLCVKLFSCFSICGSYNFVVSCLLTMYSVQLLVRSIQRVATLLGAFDAPKDIAALTTLTRYGMSFLPSTCVFVASHVVSTLHASNERQSARAAQERQLLAVRLVAVVVSREYCC
jgi:hypothetical protein